MRIKLNLKRIDPLKAAVINGLIMAAVTLVALIPIFMFMSALGPELGDAGELAIFGGVTILFFGPIIYGIIGFIFGLIGTVLLNFILDKIKGLDIEFESNNIEISQSNEEVEY